MRFKLLDFEDLKNKLPKNIEQDIHLIINRMKSEYISLNEWELDEVPIESFYCFFNKQAKKAFDVSVENGNLNIVYRRNDFGDVNSFSIRHAIQNYEF